MSNITEKLSKNTSISMTEDRFWGIVEGVNWGEISLGKYDSEGKQKEVAQHLSYKEISDLRGIFSIAWNMLDNFIGADRNPAGSGDDSHGDLISHIIGLGRKAFYNHLDNYSLIEARGKAPYNTVKGYTECFSYCLPYAEDYEHKDGRGDYEVVIESVVRETFQVKANSNDEAEKIAHTLCDKDDGVRQTIRCEKA